ncbi:MAG: thioredoxin family protein [Armatimonadota bacterium]
MPDSTRGKGYWALIVVIVLVIAVIAVKHASNRRPGSASVRVEPQPAASPPPAAVPAAAAKPKSAQNPSPSPTTRPAPVPPGAAATAKPPAPKPVPTAAPETPKPIEPLPASEFETSLKSGRPTIADFGAGWCEWCKKMAPVLAEAAGKHKGKLNVVFINTDDDPALARQYRISSIPAQVFFDSKGKEVGRHVGYYPIEELDAQLKSLGLIK